ncbi:DNA-binding transcriptional response regulator, NtrC family, contains REC, AAA-type ATPase, and a Fis-type DNA-binding domains [Chitinophaga sp. YR573]|uniref:sigma 54-interacting response regulator n=1 Tax=Chitinophaga sp. YR573 TaxID=1881040 RepID=UPI0008B2C199|nr:sigma 54-interacting response regulator [Chitinophaga sp. YR573]SEV88297.1 DNA-binding transcriptional response regulator, NtrC family, contains REC, AAA-type ATPase, and a Fis-type DNA-binding domains [Chitinophaga sp. YR573]
MNIKILIVEDEFIVGNALRLAVENGGYSVTGIMASVEEAEENIRSQQPDLVLLDIRLEGASSGIDLARKLRSENIPFIYLSAHSSQKILEEAKTTEPYGFLVKPFREKDLLVALEIALYRHRHSLEAQLRQEDFLQKQLAAISNETTTAEQKLLKIARLLQSYIPFDLISVGPRPFDVAQFNDTTYLRIGFDEYQFIREQELTTITGLTKDEFSCIIKNSHTDTDAIIYRDELNDPSLQKIWFDFFNCQAYLVFPVTVRNGSAVHYFFYSRQRAIYTEKHIALLGRLKIYLTELAEKMTHTARTIDQPGSTNKEPGEAANHPEFQGIIGNHPLLLTTLDLTTRIAPYNTSVLILGESGTGKEKVAYYIHALSQRTKGPFVKVNCAAIPTTLIESELFGHEKGAFTGAIEKRKGRFEQADGGTIFLDEIGELPLDMQVKLLRVLQEKEISSVGSSSSVKVNVRIVAATNRNLEKEVAEGNFRLDLYYRLNVFPITLPPLRERKTDIEALALFFANRFCQEFNKPFEGITASMMEEMRAYNWPGNIRELENIIEQSVILNDGKSKLELMRSLTMVAPAVAGEINIETLEDVKHVQKETERAYLISILKRTNGRIRGTNGAAEILNIKPTTLEAKIAKLNIKRQDFIHPTENP